MEIKEIHDKLDSALRCATEEIRRRVQGVFGQSDRETMRQIALLRVKDLEDQGLPAGALVLDSVEDDGVCHFTYTPPCPPVPLTCTFVLRDHIGDVAP